MNLLAQAYANNGDKDKAIAEYQAIIDANPDTRRAEYAEYAITNLGGTCKTSGSGTGQSTAGTADTADGAQNSGYTDADGDGIPDETGTAGTDIAGAGTAGGNNEEGG